MCRTSGIISTVTTRGFFITTKGLVVIHLVGTCPWKSLTNHFLKQFNEECYNVIQAFQRERNINIAIHVKDLNAQGNGIYVHQNKKQQEHFPMQSSCSSMQKLLGKDNVPKNSHDAQ
jgi:phosphoglycerate-specific signal transduction histidine kinase